METEDASKTDIWFPLYIGEHLADTMNLSTEQHGAYLLFLCYLWRHKRLRNDEKHLAEVAKLPISRWRAHRPVLEQFFCVNEQGWTHGRVDRERARAEQRGQVNAERAKRGGEARWSAQRARKEEAPGVVSRGAEDVSRDAIPVAPAQHWPTTSPALPEIPWRGPHAKAAVVMVAPVPQLSELQFRQMLGRRALSCKRRMKSESV